MTNGPTPEKILQLGTGFWASKTLLTAVELGVFTELAKGPQPLDVLEKRLGLHPRGARDFLDALVALRMLNRPGGRYSNTAEADLFLDRAKPSYVGGLLEMLNARLYGFWAHLTTALRTGGPQNEVRHGRNLFQELYADPARLRGFLTAMTGVSMGPARALAEKLPWAEAKSFADVGCAQGCGPVTIARAHPHLMGVGFDLPQVGPVFEDYARANGVADRVRFQGGDFFKDPLPKADVIIMGHILHDWNLDEKKALIKKAYEALPKGGRFVAYDALIDDERKESVFGLLMSLNMLIETPGGFDYTGRDGRGWFEEAGFRDVRTEPLAGPHGMTIGTK
jgi:SAM-dependent methyltransferase